MRAIARPPRVARQPPVRSDVLATSLSLVMTADANVAAIAVELHAHLHLKKPVTLAQLYAVARQFCEPMDAR